MDGDAFRELARDHRDLLWVVENLKPGTIHRDSRCMKMPAPHVITMDCTHLPEKGPVCECERGTGPHVHLPKTDGRGRPVGAVWDDA